MGKRSSYPRGFRIATDKVQAGHWRRSDTNATIDANVKRRSDRVDRAASGKVHLLGKKSRLKSFLDWMKEEAPPGWDRRVEKLKPKMQKQYGDKAGERVAFAVAWKQYNKEHGGRRGLEHRG